MELRYCSSKEEYVKDDIIIVEQTSHSMKFILNNATNELAALFRKIMMVDVPTMAFYIVNIYKNTTMYETFNIIRTIRSIPLKINPDDYPFFEDCKCTEMIRNDKSYRGEIIGGCDNCSVCFGLSVVGEWKDDILREVTIRNIWASDEKYDKILMDIPEIPIARMKRNEELYLTTRAVKGTGNDNALWSPVTIVTFCKLNSKDDDDDIPCYKEDQSFGFYFETVGSLTPMQVLNKANEIYQKQKLILNREKSDMRNKYLPDTNFLEEDRQHLIPYNEHNHL